MTFMRWLIAPVIYLLEKRIITRSIERSQTTIDVGRQFSMDPRDGSLFKEMLLLPALNDFYHVKIDCDNVATGLTRRFCEEAFGALIEEHGFTYKRDLEYRISFTNTLKSDELIARECMNNPNY